MFSFEQNNDDKRNINLTSLFCSDLSHSCRNFNQLVKLYMCKRRGRWRPVGKVSREEDGRGERAKLKKEKEDRRKAEVGKQKC